MHRRNKQSNRLSKHLEKNVEQIFDEEFINFRKEKLELYGELSKYLKEKIEGG